MRGLGDTASKKTVIGFADRLGQAVENAGGVAAAVKATGISDSQVRRYIGGVADPSFTNVVLLADFCGVSLEWLAYNQGSVVLDEGLRVNHAGLDEIVMIPVLNIRAAAGAGSINHSASSTDQFPIHRATLRGRGISPENVHAIRVVGDSMSPTIDDGSLILVDRAQTEIVEGGVYVVSLGDEVRIKRLHKTMSGRITLRSDGDKTFFPDEELGRQEAEQLMIHGRVFWAEKPL